MVFCQAMFDALANNSAIRYTIRGLLSNSKSISTKRYRVNHQIRLPQVAVIDETGKHIGEMDTAQALALAQGRGLDLVEIAPMARPPVCKILDFGAFTFQIEKKERKAKAHQKKVELKGIRLTFKIGQHDLDTRKAQSLKFLDAGNKVMVEMRLRGRENAHRDLARQQMEKFVQDLGADIAIETPLSIQGNRLTLIAGRKK
jgi:translation initiation factor IF-3